MEPRPLTNDEIDKFPKGHVVSVERLEEATGHKCGSQAYGLAILTVGQQIERRKEEQGQVVTTCVHKGCLQICTDAEAVGRNWKRGEHHLRGLGRAVKRINGVDIRQLTADEQRSQERKSLALGAIWQAAESEARNHYLLPAHSRNVPGLMEANTR